MNWNVLGIRFIGCIEYSGMSSYKKQLTAHQFIIFLHILDLYTPSITFHRLDNWETGNVLEKEN